MSRLVALGDIHAHHTELMALYQQLLDDGFNPEVDTLIGLVDAIDGGPDTKKVINQLMAWQQAYPHWVFLKGNHCQMMLNALDAGSDNSGVWDLWWNQGGRHRLRAGHHAARRLYRPGSHRVDPLTALEA
jgi:hypothetical protein